MGRQGFRKAFGGCNLMARSKGGYQEIYGNRESYDLVVSLPWDHSMSGRQCLTLCEFLLIHLV